MDELPLDPVMRRWWAHMKDIMAANEDRGPATAPLVEMFHLDYGSRAVGARRRNRDLDGRRQTAPRLEAKDT